MRELQVLGNGHLRLDFADWKEFFEAEMAEQLRSQLKSMIEHALEAERDYYLYLFLDGIVLKVRDSARKVRRRMILVAYGVTRAGQRRVLAYQFAQDESQAAWEQFLQDLYLRGLEGRTLQLIVSDGGKGLQAALPFVFPNPPVQRSWPHRLTNIADKVSRKEGSCVAGAPATVFARSKNPAQPALPALH